MENTEHEILVLKNISQTQSICQRKLSKAIGLSLGMTNVIIGRLFKKGLLQIKKINNRSIQYIISPTGMKAITERSFIYFKRTIKNIMLYRENIDRIIDMSAKSKYVTIALIGKSDLDFIIEHACYKRTLKFIRADAVFKSESTFFFISESEEQNEISTEVRNNIIYLRSILTI